ncbi:Di-sulfide bridge nucleocytoplasmic transport domain-containing protein, partial [Lipomyces orientalis]
MMDTMDYSPADRGSLIRGHETPMDFAYHSGGPVLDATSPFRDAAIMAAAATASNSKMPGSFSQSSRSVSDQTPIYTPRTTGIGHHPFSSSVAYQSTAASPLYGRGTSKKSAAQSPMNLIDEDVVMLSSPPSTSSRKLCTEKDSTSLMDTADASDASDGEVVQESTSSRFLKVFRSNSAGNSSSPLTKAKQLLSLSTKRKSSSQKSGSKKVKYPDECHDGFVDEEGDDSDTGSDWSGRIVVKKTTVLRSPRKGSSSRIGYSPRKVSRSLPGGSLPNINHHNPSLLAFLSRHDNLPFVLASYLQLIFNVFLVLVMLYLIMSFVLMIRHDISTQIAIYVAEAKDKIAKCEDEYFVNGCESRVPQLQEFCEEKATCMTRDPNDVGRAGVSAETVARIVNSFIEEISYKTMVFVFVLMFGSVYVSSSKVAPSSVVGGQHHQVPEKIYYQSQLENSEYAGALPPPQTTV